MISFADGFDGGPGLIIIGVGIAAVGGTYTVGRGVLVGRGVAVACHVIGGMAAPGLMLMN